LAATAFGRLPTKFPTIFAASISAPGDRWASPAVLEVVSVQIGDHSVHDVPPEMIKPPCGGFIALDGHRNSDSEKGELCGKCS